MDIKPTQEKTAVESSQAGRNFKKTSDIKPRETEYSGKYPDAVSMRAYANIKPTEPIVPKKEVLEYILSTGHINEQKNENFIKILTDSDGHIKKETLDWVKKTYEKTHNLYLAMNYVEHSKEGEKINHKVLEILDPAIDTMKSSRFNSQCFNLPDYFKDKNGMFNDNALDCIKKVTEENPKRLLIRPESIIYPFLDKKKEFDLEAINYYKEQSTLNRDFKEISNEILAGRDSFGKFSTERLNIYKELEPHLEKWQIGKTLSLIDKVENKKEFLELAKTMKEDKDLADIFDSISDIKSNPQDKTGLKYDSKSVEFIRDLQKASRGRPSSITNILKKLNLPVEEYTPEKTDSLKKIFDVIWNTEDIEPLIDAATMKAGEKKGKLSFENLNKYLDIYKSEPGRIAEVNYLSGILSMETDNKALDTIHKLYGLRWTEDGRYGQKTNTLNRPSLHFIFDLSTHSIDGKPEIKFLPKILDNFNKLMELKLPMSSAKAFENFMTFGEFDIIEKLDKIRLDEIGIPMEDLTNWRFKKAPEEELFAFKNYMLDYMKDKNKKYIKVNLNNNISDLVEIVDESGSGKTTKIMYNMAKQSPSAKTTISNGLYNLQKEQIDYEKNIIVKQLFRKQKEGYEEYEILSDQVVEKYDKKGNLLYTEEMKPSEVKGVFNVTKKYPDGKVEDIVKATKSPDGYELVEKNLISPDGIKTVYRYENDPLGNNIMDYKIIDKKGNVLMNQSSSFEVRDENHFVTSRNNKVFDVKFDGDFVHVKDMQTGKIADINLVNFTKTTQKDLIPVLKKIPGDELYKMKEFDLKNLILTDSVSNAAYNSKLEQISVKKEFLDEGVLMHEWGHGKDEIAFKEIAAKIADEPELRKIYEKEKSKVREVLSEAQLDHLAYFGADSHYLGVDKIKEGLAETNMLLDLLPKHIINSVRAHYWMQDFPKTIAYVAKLLH